MNSTPPILQLDKLTVQYGNFTALKEFSARFPGGALGLLGPNGAGKSTLLRAILGLVSPSSGNGSALGLDIKKGGAKLRSRIGYMPEQDCYITGMSGVRGLAHLAEVCGFLPDDAMLRAHDVLHFVGLGEERYREVSDYSVGMRQRYKLAAALVHDPDVLFLDEPTNGLDPRGRARMLDLIDRTRKEHGLHLILASHLLPDVELLCDEVWVLDNGVLKQSGTISKLTSAARGACRLRTTTEKTEAITTAAQALGIHVLPGNQADELLLGRPDEAVAPVEVFQLTQSCNAPVFSLKPAARSLEDAFLEALESN
ncbi:MAG: ABC transporter ATP-binding protein [Planctomycetota bacterium]|jgi:ABC-2 type transport system ATP-binding protein|nr:ABC transporter ATP-binding protein [Planctomycetota bacterium]MDP6942327.1 ABC transporter ATP-binding protein [Planctomycetota bacterium]